VARIRPEMVRFRTGRRREFSSLGARCAVRADTASLDCLSLSSLSRTDTPVFRAIVTHKTVVDVDWERSWSLQPDLKWSRMSHKELGGRFSSRSLSLSLTCRQSSNYKQEDMTYCLKVVIHAALK
jgi:hypothetical protein